MSHWSLVFLFIAICAQTISSQYPYSVYNNVPQGGFYFPPDVPNRFQTNQRPTTTSRPIYRPPNNNWIYNEPFTTRRTTQWTTTQRSTTQRVTPPQFNNVGRISQESKRKQFNFILSHKLIFISIECQEYSKQVNASDQAGNLFLPGAPVISLPNCDFSSGLIIGGIVTAPGEFPHMAAIGYRKLNRQLIFGCGGSLISEQFVLTAAHCSRAQGLRPSIVRLGDQNLFKKDSTLPEIEIPIGKFIPHEHYSFKTRQNDIALIELQFPILFSKNVRPACLWQSQSIGRSDSIATGWGYTKYSSGVVSDDLMKVSLNIEDTNICASDFGESGYVVNGKHICAGNLKGGEDTCAGGELDKFTIVINKMTNSNSFS